MTIFQPDNYGLPYQDYLNSREFLVAVPYTQTTKILNDHPFCTIDYALVKCSDINKLQNLDVTAYNLLLDQIKVFKFCLYQPTMHQPTRFCIVSETEFNAMIADPRIYSPGYNKKVVSEDKKPCCELKLVSAVDGHTNSFTALPTCPI